MAEGTKVANCHDTHLKGVWTLLENWHMTTWLGQYCRQPCGHQCLLSDTLVTSIATKACFKSVEELINSGWSPIHADKHRDEVLVMLREYDEVFHEKWEEDKCQKVDKRKQETVEPRAAKCEAVLEERAQKQAQPKKPQPSCAKKTPMPVIMMDMTTSYLNGFAAPFTPIATPSILVPHPGHKNIPPHIISPHMLTPPSLHYAPLPPPSPYPLSMMTTGLLTPAHFYADYYPPSFLYLNWSQSWPKFPNTSGQLLASMSPGYGTILH